MRSHVASRRGADRYEAPSFFAYVWITSGAARDRKSKIKISKDRKVEKSKSAKQKRSKSEKMKV
jgi:hypothetical protein